MAKKVKKSKVDNSIINIWTLNELFEIEQIQIPISLRMEFINFFGVEKLPYQPLVQSWLDLKNI
jgi:hypothetical protein